MRGRCRGGSWRLGMLEGMLSEGRHVGMSRFSMRYKRSDDEGREKEPQRSLPSMKIKAEDFQTKPQSIQRLQVPGNLKHKEDR
jgi:hypothetical protein